MADQAANTASEFAVLYYKQMDKSRHLISKLYTEAGVLVWNGNGTLGCEKIQKFLLDIPASEHTITTMDAQPITYDAVATQPTNLIQVSGTVKYLDCPDRAIKSFQQTFMITALADKWKIVSDCFRLQGQQNLKEGMF